MHLHKRTFFHRISMLLSWRSHFEAINGAKMEESLERWKGNSFQHVDIRKDIFSLSLTLVLTRTQNIHNYKAMRDQIKKKKKVTVISFKLEIRQWNLMLMTTICENVFFFYFTQTIADKARAELSLARERIKA